MSSSDHSVSPRPSSADAFLFSQTLQSFFTTIHQLPHLSPGTKCPPPPAKIYFTWISVCFNKMFTTRLCVWGAIKCQIALLCLLFNSVRWSQRMFQWHLCLFLFVDITDPHWPLIKRHLLKWCVIKGPVSTHFLIFILHAEQPCMTINTKKPI